MNILTKWLFDVAEPYAEWRDVSMSTLGRLVANDGKMFGRLRDGGDIGVTRWVTAMRWFSDHWPDGVAWPVHVPRRIDDAKANTRKRLWVKTRARVKCGRFRRRRP